MKILVHNGTDRMHSLIEICKSDSGIMGVKLRNAHRELGKMMGDRILRDSEASQNNNLSVICLMRSGLCFGEGIADFIDCPTLFLDENNDKKWNTPDEKYGNKYIKEYLEHIENRTVIVSDAVLNTGKTIRSICKLLIRFATKVIIAVNVIQSSAANTFDDWDTYTIRLSENKFVGAKTNIQLGGIGPDTGDRLFKLITK